MTAELDAREPQDIDEERYAELGQIAKGAILRGRPVGGQGCGECLYYLEPDAELSYCWHPKLRLLVGGDWWCQWWEVNAET